MTVHSLNGAAGIETWRIVAPGRLSNDDAAALIAIADPVRHVRYGTDIAAEGMGVDRIHLLVDGWSCRYRTTRNGARQITGLNLPGDVCNPESWLRPSLGAGVRTITSVSVLGLPRVHLQRLAADRPGVRRFLTSCIVSEHAILTEWALSLGRHSARTRVAHLLCEIATRLTKGTEASASFDWPVTQEQIGDVLGLTAVHTNRVLGQLRCEGLIVVAGRLVTIPDMQRLGREGEFDAAYLDPACLDAEAGIGRERREHRNDRLRSGG